MLITRVRLRLNKRPRLNLRYAGVREELAQMAVTEPTVADVSRAVAAGAAPIQNVGAYGAQLSDVFVDLEAVPLDGGNPCTMNLTGQEVPPRPPSLTCKRLLDSDARAGRCTSLDRRDIRLIGTLPVCVLTDLARRDDAELTETTVGCMT